MRWLLICLTMALVGCSDRTAAPIRPDALAVGLNKKVFIGTTRALNESGEYGIGRSTQLSLLQSTISIPPQRDLGSVSNGLESPKPERDFALATLDEFDTPTSFAAALSRDITSNKASGREVTVFVHGFNNSFADSAFRLAQLGHDLEVPGSFVSYSWPSRANPLGYEYDRDSALFARDGLADLLETIGDAGDPEIILVAHSMGSALVMETLRQLEIAQPGWAKKHIRGVMLMSPDINIDVFRSQLKRFREVPDPFVVIVSRKDAILRLSSRLRGEKTQLGNISNVESVSDLPITLIDVSAFSDRRSGNHFVAGSSPALIQLLRQSEVLDREFLRGRGGASIIFPGQQRLVSQPVSPSATPNPGEAR